MQMNVLRLAGFLAAVALATSRLGLIAHELVGHGGAALAFGGQVNEVELFWFAGGWIRYTLPGPDPAALLTIAMAGIAVELVIGGALWLGVRGASLGRRVVRAVGTGLVVHGTWYLAVGAFHGLGDGIILYRYLGDGRVIVSVIAGLVTCTATYLGARAITRPLVDTLPGTLRQRAIGFAIAALIGGALHAALTIGELRLRRDDTYASMMKPERERRIAIEVSAWQEQRAAQGQVTTADQVRTERARLERSHRSFPFVVVLALATLLSLAAGIVRSSRNGPENLLTTSLLMRAVVLAVASIAAVIVIQLVLAG